MTAAALLLAAAVLMAARRPGARLRAGAAGEKSVATGAHRTVTADPLAAASALDVLAVCLSAGMPVSAAAAATAPSAPPELRAVLQRAADLLRLGADPETAWSVDAAPIDHHCEALARLARRSALSGSALAGAVAELAERSRQDAAHTAAAAAERAGVLIAGPLGLCFLPAFVCVGVVPVVAGLAGDVFTAGLL